MYHLTKSGDLDSWDIYEISDTKEIKWYENIDPVIILAHDDKENINRVHAASIDWIKEHTKAKHTELEALIELAILEIL